MAGAAGESEDRETALSNLYLKSLESVAYTTRGSTDTPIHRTLANHSSQDTGIKAGKNYAVNVPLRDGINDVSFPSIFEPVRPPPS